MRDPSSSEGAPTIHAIPTDTCFGLACDFWDLQSYLRLYDLKKRPVGKPFSIVVKDFGSLRRCIVINDDQVAFLSAYEHPFTILGTKREDFAIPDFLDAGTYSRIAVRIASLCLPEGLVDRFSYPMFLTSANMSGEPEIYDSSEFLRLFPEGEVKVWDRILPERPPSDIFAFVGGTTEIGYVRNHRKGIAEG